MHHRIRFKTCALDQVGLQGAWALGQRHLHFAGHGNIDVPASRTKSLGSRAYAISGPHSWNSIPVALRDTTLSFHEFCVKLKTELYHQINWNWTISTFVTVLTVRSFLCVEQILHTYFWSSILAHFGKYVSILNLYFLFFQSILKCGKFNNCWRSKYQCLSLNP